ncbi:DUF3105 domain-containing protein [Candidatus Daviesbacteria bacterium]|nr:DUF3105 domain-containing protein [Candidatus Daviesbacteria bacterium]
MNKKFIIIGFFALLLIIGLGWAYWESTKPLPGKQDLWNDRTHKIQGTKIEYKSNPPTSGPHYFDWTRPGVYDSPPMDGNLVHSLEHGYVIIWYNCDQKATSDKLTNDKLAFVASVFAHEASDSGLVEASDSAQATPVASLSANFKTESCQKLVGEFKQVFEKEGKRKLIVTPRANMETRIALTAWGRLDQFNNFDEARIENFINKLRDQGPEQTME